jgi:DNA-binding transcriptional LysR family regulator
MTIKNQQLINAHALLEYRSFRKAAHSQNISQSAFSRSIANLETALGVELFNRTPSEVTPTIFGKTLFKYSQQILTSTKELEREIDIINGLGAGELSVAMGPYPAELSGHKAAGRILAKSPKLRCKMVVTGWREVEKMVMARSVDLGLAELGEAQNNKYLELEEIGKHQFVFFCRPDHPVLKYTKISKAKLDIYPLVLIKLPERLAPFFPGQLFQDKGFDYVIPSVEIQDLTLSRQIVAESDAISAATPLQIQNELKSGTFSVIPFFVPWMTLNYGFMFLRDRVLSPIAKRYMEVVREIEVDVKESNLTLFKNFTNQL